MRKSTNLKNRFWERVKKGRPNDCWIWLLCKDKDGYGQFNFNKKRLRAHRVSFLLANKTIKKSLLVCHKCNNPPCVNPKHLYAGTQADNDLDAVRAGTKYYVQSKVGTAHHSNKLTKDQVIFILGSKLSGSCLAKMFGVSNMLISKIRRRSIWKHIENHIVV